MFNLDPKLQQDCFFVQDLKISRLLLMNDSNYKWLILVPRIQNLVEITDLKLEQQIELLQEINLLSKILKVNFKADKLNIANLGNVVSQLHIHIIARFKNDVTFPQPIWGNKPSKPYDKEQAVALIDEIKNLIKCQSNF